MKFQLRKIDYSARLSEETHCFAAHYTCGKPYQLEDVRKKYPSAVFLNGKPFDEAFALFAADARKLEVQ